VKSLILIISLLFSINGSAGKDTGLFVLKEPPSEAHPQGEWEAKTERNLRTVKEYWGLKNLVAADCSDESVCESPTYAKYLLFWMEALRPYLPELTTAMEEESDPVLFRYVNNTLRYIPDDLPERVEDFRKYIKAAVYRPHEANEGVVYVSIPAMERHGQIEPTRISADLGRGQHLFHEMLNIIYHGDLSPDQISDFGVTLLDAHYANRDCDGASINSGCGMSKEEFLYRLVRKDIPVLTDPRISMASKMTIIEYLNDKGILDKYVPFSESDTLSEINLSKLTEVDSYSRGQISLNELIGRVGGIVEAIYLLRAFSELGDSILDKITEDLTASVADQILKTHQVVPFFRSKLVKRYQESLFREEEVSDLFTDSLLEAINRYGRETVEEAKRRGLLTRDDFELFYWSKMVLKGEGVSNWNGQAIALPEFTGVSGRLFKVRLKNNGKRNVRSLTHGRSMEPNDFIERSPEGIYYFRDGLFPFGWKNN
jgi:hypothetical protein